MNHTDESQIDAVLDNAVQRSRRGEVIDIEDYCRSYPELAGDLRLMLPALCLLEQPAIAMNGAIPEVPIPTSLADFKIIREIGRGAMGVVYEAVQQSLGRRVALKIFRPAPESRKLLSARFRREAETAARLHHSNIIPIFGSGESDGCFYYAMQLIEGLNLQQLMAGKPLSPDEFVGQSDAEPGQNDVSAETIHNAGSTEEPASEGKSQAIARPFVIDPIRTPQDSARIALQIAEGLSFAHQHGVIHRDIKPSNIILDADGRAWIADFGLAKPEDGENLTSSGNIVGTLRYLAPEGFQGENGPRGDIYSLGLTLFELLEGRPAHTQNVRAQLIHQVLHGPSPQLSRKLPTDLKTICHKCIEKNPGDRYQSAAMLAEDLRRFLDGRPITSRVVGISEKMVRWSRRNPLIVSLIACVLVIGLAGVITAWSLSGRASRLSTESKKNFEQARQNLTLVLETVDRFCLTVSEDQRLNRPEFKQLRGQLLQSAIDINEKFVGDPAVAKEANLQLARIHLRLGNLGGSGQDTLAESERHLKLARELLLELCESEGYENEFGLELVRCERGLGRIQFLLGDSQLAQVLLQSSLKRTAPLLLNDEMAAITKLEKARTLSALGTLYTDTRRNVEAEFPLLESIALLDSLYEAYPDHPDLKFELASSLGQLGKLYVTNVRQLRNAEQPLRDAGELMAEILEAEPDSPDIIINLAVLLRWQAKCQFMANDPSQAIEIQEQAIVMLKELFNRQGEIISNQRELAIALRSQCDFMMVANRDDPAILELLDESEQVLSALIVADPDNQANIVDLASSRISHADLLVLRNERQRALQKIEKAIPLLDQVLASSPGDPRAAEHRHFAAVTKAELLDDFGRSGAALAEWKIAIRLAPPMFVALTRIKRAKTLIRAGDIVEGLLSVEEVLAGQHPDRKPNQFLIQESAVAFALASEAVIANRDDPDREKTGESYASRSISFLLQLLQLNPAKLKFIETSSALDCLRDQADFKALLVAARNKD